MCAIIYQSKYMGSPHQNLESHIIGTITILPVIHNCSLIPSSCNLIIKQENITLIRVVFSVILVFLYKHYVSIHTYVLLCISTFLSTWRNFHCNETQNRTQNHWEYVAVLRKVKNHMFLLVFHPTWSSVHQEKLISCSFLSFPVGRAGCWGLKARESYQGCI